MDIKRLFFLILFLAVSDVDANDQTKKAAKDTVQEPSQENKDFESSNVPEKESVHERQDLLKIEKIEYVGCQRVEPETVASYLPLRVGQVYDDYSINEALKALYATDFYEDALITTRGNTLIVEVKEYPIVEKIAFEGNSKISDKDILSSIKLKSKEVLSPSKIKTIQQGLLNTYRKNMGRYNASVTPKIIKLDGNRVNVVFEINEGCAAGIKDIRFVGNSRFSSEELRVIISSKIKRWYRFFADDDVYDSDRLAADKSSIYRYYKEHGFANIQILSALAELSQDKTGFILTFVIEEGDTYKFGGINVVSDIKILSQKKKLDMEDLSRDLYCKKGDIYNAVLIETDIADLTKSVHRKGIPAIRVLPKVKCDEKSKSIDITFHIEEGQMVYVSKILIKGNTRTRDHIIRREIPIHEGDALNDSLISLAKNNLRSLGFFKSVCIDTVPDTNSPDKCVIQVEVEEQSTGSISVGGSIGTVTGFGIDLAYSERNFFGTGKALGVSVNSGKVRCGKSYKALPNGRQVRIGRKTKFKLLNSITARVSDPHFLDKDVEGFISVHKYSSGRFDSFSAQEIGTGVGISYEINSKLHQGWEYGFSNRKFEDIYAFASPIIKYQTLTVKDDVITLKPQTSKISFLKHDVGYGTQFLTGPKGFLSTGVITTFAGLGGNAKHLKNELYGSYTIPIMRRLALRFGAIGGILSKVGKNPPLVFDSFTLGLDSFRGFDDCGVGPRAVTVRKVVDPVLGGFEEEKTTDYIGASRYWKGTVELKAPVGLPAELQCRVHLFSDFGRAWNAPDKGEKALQAQVKDSGSTGIFVSHQILDSKKIRVSVGVGVSILTPFGPLLVTYAVPVRKEKYDEQQRILVGFSTTF